MNERFPALDARLARRRFERAAATYGTASRLEAEIGARMLERLDYLKLAPRRILDAGSGPGRDAGPLRSKFAGAQLIEVDFSLAMLLAGRRRFFEKKQFICADLASLPLAAGAVDFVWSNMALHWAADAPAALKEFARVMAAEGLVMFSTLGPDTLRELRAAAGAARVHQFIDMHDIGDMLVEAGFTAPVMDMEHLTFTYRSPDALIADLRASGQTNARLDRARGLGGKAFAKNLAAGLGLSATFEVVYGHAWKGAPRKLEDGRDIVKFRARRT